MSKQGLYTEPWDFSVPQVTSMSVDVHKYGFASKGASVVGFRDPALRRLSYVPSWDGCEGLYVTTTLQGSRSGVRTHPHHTMARTKSQIRAHAQRGTCWSGRASTNTHTHGREQSAVNLVLNEDNANPHKHAYAGKHRSSVGNDAAGRRQRLSKDGYRCCHHHAAYTARGGGDTRVRVSGAARLRRRPHHVAGVPEHAPQSLKRVHAHQHRHTHVHAAQVVDIYLVASVLEEKGWNLVQFIVHARLGYDVVTGYLIALTFYSSQGRSLRSCLCVWASKQFTLWTSGSKTLRVQLLPLFNPRI